MELAPLPGDVRKHFPDGGQIACGYVAGDRADALRVAAARIEFFAIVSIGRDHHEATQTAFLQACQKVLPCLTGLVPINGEPKDFALSVLACT